MHNTLTTVDQKTKALRGRMRMMNWTPLFALAMASTLSACGSAIEGRETGETLDETETIDETETVEGTESLEETATNQQAVDVANLEVGYAYYPGYVSAIKFGGYTMWRPDKVHTVEVQVRLHNLPRRSTPARIDYQLTLSGYNTTRSVCQPRCGDGVATATEECDDGPANSDNAYGGCATACKFGPFCGDGVVDASGMETCDGGRQNGAGYGDKNGCTTVCRPSHYCGDGFIDSTFGEQCDDGANNGVGACAIACTLMIK